jgi:hypothetical protein
MLHGLRPKLLVACEGRWGRIEFLLPAIDSQILKHFGCAVFLRYGGLRDLARFGACGPSHYSNIVRFYCGGGGRGLRPPGRGAWDNENSSGTRNNEAAGSVRTMFVH